MKFSNFNILIVTVTQCVNSTVRAEQTDLLSIPDNASNGQATVQLNKGKLRGSPTENGANEAVQGVTRRTQAQEHCVGDRSTYNAGWGACGTYVLENSSFCNIDRDDDGILAADACSECSKCTDSSKDEVGTCQWLDGMIGDFDDRALGELFRQPFMSQAGVEACLRRAHESSFDGFYTYNQSGEQACIFFNLEKFKDVNTLPAVQSAAYNDLAKSTGALSHVLPLSDIWLKGRVGNHADRGLSELFHHPFMSEEGIDACKNRADQHKFDSFYVNNQNGLQACVFFESGKMKSQSTLRELGQLPDASTVGHTGSHVSYIMPRPLSEALSCTATTAPFSGVYVREDLELGNLSYHLLALNDAYISLENLGGGLCDADGSNCLPSRNEFEGAAFDEATRTFTGTVSWPVLFCGEASSDYTMVFSEDFFEIIGGQYQAFDADGFEMYTFDFGSVRYIKQEWP